jgi:hypothetical protein
MRMPSRCRFLAKSLVASIVSSSTNVNDFAIITGVGDSSTFNNNPTWQQGTKQDACYIGARPPAHSRVRRNFSATRSCAVVPAGLQFAWPHAGAQHWSSAAVSRQQRRAAVCCAVHGPVARASRQRCAAADATKPAADIAAQVGAALAMLAKYFDPTPDSAT